MNFRKALGLILPLVAASSCAVDTSSACSFSYPEAEVPPGNMTTAAFFHYGNQLFSLGDSATHANATSDGFDASLGDFHLETHVEFFVDDIIHESSLLTYHEETPSPSTHQYYELTHIGDGYIHTIHEEEGWENDYRVSVENNITNYRDIFYIGMSRDYFKYFDSTHRFDDATFQRSGTIEDNVVTLRTSLVIIGEISIRLNLAVEIVGDSITRFELERKGFSEGVEVLSETYVETFSYEAKRDFPWGVIDWYNYHDYPER